jgi:hypothetical protein
MLHALIIPPAAASVKRITGAASLRRSEKAKIGVEALAGRFSYLPVTGGKPAFFEGFLKPIKGVFSAFLPVSPSPIFPVFEPFEARRVYA